MNNKVSIVIVIYPKLSSLRNDRSINLNLSDDVRLLQENMRIAGKYEDQRLQSKERINVLFVMT